MTEPRDVLSRSAPPPQRTTAYGLLPTEVYEVFPPAEAGAANGTVALIHGGFWRAEYDRTHLRPLANSLAAQGFWVASLEYPRVGMPGGGWPGTTDSVRRGLAAVATDPGLPGPVVAIGHSAGGHLAVWVAGEAAGPDLAGVVALAGVLDLQLAAELALDDDAAMAFVGCSPAEGPDAWERADPARRPLRVPTVLVHGDRDVQVPLALSASYLAARQPTDAACALRELEGVEHFGLIDPTHPTAYPALVAAVTDLIGARS